MLQTKVTLKTADGHFITAAADGSMKAEEESFVPEALFLLMPADGDKVVLKAQNDRYVKAEPGGLISAVSEKWDDWEEFDLVKQDGGKVSLRSFHEKYIAAKDGSVAANSATATVLELVNRSMASQNGSAEAHAFHKTISDLTSHSVCSRPSEKAAVRCCSSAGAVVKEDSYGCHNLTNYSEAVAICEAEGLQLCTDAQARSCTDCSICGSATQHIWTSSTCSGTEGLTQRRLGQRNDRASVFSNFCGYQPDKGGLHGEEVRSTVFVKLSLGFCR